MMKHFTGRSMTWMLALSMLAAGGGVAQVPLDESSLFAQQDLLISDAVEGSLPENAGGNDDFLSALFGDDAPAVEGSAIPAADLALDDLFAAPPAAYEEAVDSLFAADLDNVVEGLEAAPADTADLFPVETPWDADAVAGEMLGAGDAEDAAEPADVAALLAVDESVPAVPVAGDADLADLFAAEEPAPEAGARTPVMDLDAFLDDLTGAEPAGMQAAAEAPAGDEPPAAADAGLLPGDDFLAGLPGVEEKGGPAPVEAPDTAEDVPVAGDLDDLFKELVQDEEAFLADPLGLPLTEASVTEAPLADVPAVEAPPAAPMVEIAPMAPAPAAGDDLSLDDDFFRQLTQEVKPDAAPAAVPAPAAAAAPDPFEDVLSAMIDEAEAAVAPAPAPAPVDAAPAADDVFGFAAEEPAPIQAPAPAVAFDEPALDPEVPLPEGTAAFREAERLKRVAIEHHAMSTLQNADTALRDKDYNRAIRLYEEALKRIPRRADMEPVRAQARRSLGSAYYLQSLSFERMEDYEGAKVAAQNAVRFGYIRAESSVARITRKMEPAPPKQAPVPRHRWNEEDYIKSQEQVRDWMRKGREAYLTGEYDKAIQAFESVLARDPENKEAIRLMRSAANKKLDRSSMELEATRSRMMATVRDTWNPRSYGLHEDPIEKRGPDVTTVQLDEKQRLEILQRMESIRIPEVDFRQANIRDVVSFLGQQSRESDPLKRGVNIILKLEADAPAGARRAAPAAAASPFGAAPSPFGDPGGGAARGVADEIMVTFSALDITLKEALDIVVDVASLKYRVRGNVVMILPRDAPEGDIEHRMYDVLPSAITRLQELSSAVTRRGAGGDRGRTQGGFIGMEGTGDVAGEDVDLKAFFEEMGVQWPARSSIKFVRGIGKLVVANTIENIAVFEKVLSILNVVPYQIEIEARFIEVAQTDVDSLGLEWLLRDNWEIAEKKGQAALPLAARERIVMNANAGQGGITAGNRYLSKEGRSGPLGQQIMDEVMSLSGVLTNPELTVVLHALQQRGHTDLLSAPKITTQSGQQATIKVVTEYIYPTEFETSGIGGGNNNQNVGGGNQGNVGAVVTPREFTTREVGVILEVLPEVSPEGQMINLTLSPEVVSEPTWKNYGSTYTSFDSNGNPMTQTLNMEQPFFHTRKLFTNLLVYNGATVVMGGMITEVRNTVDDKIPLLGDIPLLGRLFRSSYESSEKRNLLIFVTARLVDPAGRALDRERFGVDMSIAERLVAGDGQ